MMCIKKAIVVGLGFASALMVVPAWGVPVSLDPTATLSTFDTGGLLNPALNGGLTVGGLEVDPAGGTVYVVASDGGFGGTSTVVQLLSSTGLGTATAVGAAAPIKLNARGFDVTHNAGLYYVAGTLGAAAPVHGIHGLDPAGVAAPSTFATTTSGFATSGLTFDAAGTTALVSTDGVDPVVLPNGLYSVPAGGPEAAVVLGGALPGGISGGTDDHVITLDGRTIVVGDGSFDLWDVSGGAGAVSLLVDLNTIPAVAPVLFGGGVRAAVDPWTGDIFMGWGLFGPDIIRVAADGSGAIHFATGFDSVRDLDIGLSSDGSGGVSLYVTEEDVNGVGSIYEFTLSHNEGGAVPEPLTAALGLMGLATLGMATRRRVA